MSFFVFGSTSSPSGGDELSVKVDVLFPIQTLVDLRPVLSLAQRYLDNYLLNTTLIYKTVNELYEELMELIPQIRVSPEVGILHPKDCTLIW